MLLEIMAAITINPALLGLRVKFEQLRVDIIKDQLVILKNIEKLSKEDSTGLKGKIPVNDLKKCFQDERVLLYSLTTIIIDLGGSENLTDKEMKQLDGIVEPIN